MNSPKDRSGPDDTTSARELLRRAFDTKEDADVESRPGKGRKAGVEEEDDTYATPGVPEAEPPPPAPTADRASPLD